MNKKKGGDVKMCKYANFNVLRVDNAQKTKVLAEALKNPKVVKVSAHSNNSDYYGKRTDASRIARIIKGTK